jgi:hypothetical protein
LQTGGALRELESPKSSPALAPLKSRLLTIKGLVPDLVPRARTLSISTAFDRLPTEAMPGRSQTEDASMPKHVVLFVLMALLAAANPRAQDGKSAPYPVRDVSDDPEGPWLPHLMLFVRSGQTAAWGPGLEGVANHRDKREPD